MSYLDFWDRYIQQLAKQENSFVLMQVMNQAAPESFENGVLGLACIDAGTQMYLETRRKLLEEILSSVTKTPSTIRFVIKAIKMKKKKQKSTPPAPLPLATLVETAAAAEKKAGLAPLTTFENFAVSPSNQIAYAAATAVTQNLGHAYNPLFLYGGVGVGKTHLSQAIAHQILRNNPNKRAHFCTSEEFTNDLVEQIREKNTGKFRKKYRDLDLLIVDDIQFIAGKNYVQEEFYHTFNSLVRAGGQIILTSDRPPGEIKKLEDRLRSRFSGGLNIDIQSPDFELRTAIVLIKARSRNIEIDFETASLIAEKTADARELEGQLLRIYTNSLSSGGNITKEQVNEEIDRKKTKDSVRVSPQEIIRVVSSYYDVNPSLIKKPSRKENVVLPRQVVMYLLRVNLQLKLEDIAYLLKRKDHTTVMHGVDKITNNLLKNPQFKEEVDRIIQSLGL